MDRSGDRERKLIMLVLLGIFISINGKAAIINVPADQPTIQAGIDSAIIGDTVLVHPGLYIENINFNGKSIVLSSLHLTTGDTSFINQTIIDGDNNDSVIKFIGGEDSTSVLNGFTLQRGLGVYGPPGYFSYGGGIYCRHSSPTLKNLIIKNNTYPTDGGGIYCESSHIRLYDSIIMDNFVNGPFSGNGGGIFLVRCNGKLENVEIINNTATDDGGGIAISGSNVTLKNVTILNNYSYDYGAGIAGYKANIKLQNVTSINNRAELAGGGIHCIDSTHIKIVNSIFWNDFPNEINFHEWSSLNSAAIIHSNIAGGIDSIHANNNGQVFWLQGNLNTYPSFIDTSIGNYNLQMGSPCIDAGIQDTIFLYNNNQDTIVIPPIVYKGSAPDMGAFEFDPVTDIVTKSETVNQFKIFQNYPNPFNPVTTISYQLPKTSFVNLSIYNVLGQKIDELVNTEIQAGNNKIDWNANKFSTGVYVYKITAGEYSAVGKCILIK